MSLLLISFLSPFFILAGPLNITQVVSEVEKVDLLRSQLAMGVTTQKPDLALFQAVCAPVGRSIRDAAEKQKWIFRQITHKPRNPAHAAASQVEREALKNFLDHPDLQSQWIKSHGKNYYFRRIRVERACLSCHGPQESRPDFVKANYPKDTAFDFQVGDLRGLYMVTERN